MPDQDATPSILRLKYCPKCEYDLAGLPREGRCPECGFEYDEQMFSLVGRPRKLGIWTIMISGYCMMQFMNAVRQGAMDVALLFAIAICVFIGILLLRSRLMRDRRWVLFTREGVATRHTVGEFQIIAWENFHRVRFFRTAFERDKRGLPLYMLELYQEPNRFLFQRRNSLTRTFGETLRFQIGATEEDARIAVDEMRRRFSRAWKLEEQSSKGA